MFSFFYVLAFLLVHESIGEKWENLKPSASSAEQAASVQDLLQRIVPNHAQYFEVAVNQSIGQGKSFANISTYVKDNSVIVKVVGNSGVAAAWGIGEYIKNEIHGHFSWDTFRIDMPETLPKISPRILETVEKFKYWDNVCTFGYSYAFWDWSEWEKHIDWMALSGINLALAFTGQEAIWYKVFKKAGLSDTSIFSFFSGPAFLPWNRMGNMKAWGGPLSVEFLDKRRILQHQILKRFRGLGIISVLPAFVGYVPDDLASLYPNSSFSKMGPWCTFPQTTLLNVNDTLFQKIGSDFVKEYIQEFGTDHAYNCDLFNELTPTSSDPGYLSNTSKIIYDTLVSGDPDAVWIMQGWVFLNPFWKDPEIKALLTANPKGTMILLDLDSTDRQQYTKTKGYYGQPFIFNNLNNYGGAIGLFGRSNTINERIFTVRKQYNNVIGIGFTPEGLTDTYAPTELMSEMSWRKEPLDEDELVMWYQSYGGRRYGIQRPCSDNAWSILSKTVFNATGTNFHWLTILSGEPHPNKKNVAWYSVFDLVQAWDSMHSCISIHPLYNESIGFKYDMIDLTRQVIADVAPYWFYKANNCFKSKELGCLLSNMTLFMDILNDLDILLNTNEQFMLGKWIEDARNWGSTANESNLFEMNARNQVTLWGPSGEILDYASKQWGGLISGYYLPRFSMYFNELIMNLGLGQDFNSGKFRQNFINEFGVPFSNSQKKFPSKPIGNSIDVVLQIHAKWRPALTQSFLSFVDANAKRI